MRNEITWGGIICMSLIMNILDLIEKNFGKFLEHMTIFYTVCFLFYIVVKKTKTATYIENHKWFRWLPQVGFVLFVVSKVLLNAVGGAFVAVVMVSVQEKKK